MSVKQLPASEKKWLLDQLMQRFEKNPGRHPGISWQELLALLESRPQKLPLLYEMEATGGEPDLVNLSVTKGDWQFVDCAAETPAGRRSLCYDEQALTSRKVNKPGGSAIGLAERMGVSLLSESQYRALQELGEFDLKTSSWILTPASVRERGGALFGDRRYGRVFTYHNGAESYYSARGFRAILPL